MWSPMIFTWHIDCYEKSKVHDWTTQQKKPVWATESNISFLGMLLSAIPQRRIKQGKEVVNNRFRKGCPDDKTRDFHGKRNCAIGRR